MTSPPTDPERFRTTHWTQVLAAGGDSESARLALSALCDAYYEPVHAFIRCQERGGKESARDLAHGFFTQLLEKGKVGEVAPDRGRFRSYLLGAVKHYLSDQRDRARAAKRGGGTEDLPLHEVGEFEEEGAEGEAIARRIPGTPETPDSVYDREWAMAVLHRGIDQLEQEQREAGREAQFRALRPWLNGEASSLSQAEVGKELGWEVNAVKVAIHRLRKRFREIIKSEIGQTVESNDEIPGELNYLIEALQAR